MLSFGKRVVLLGFKGLKYGYFLSFFFNCHENSWLPLWELLPCYKDSTKIELWKLVGHSRREGTSVVR
jgi:hypothetical protein